MSSTPLKEAERALTICNACRYCEGFCAVFPAMELRRVFLEKDLKYLANLCHNCRGCYYACQYAPPHEFAVNVPRIMSELRQETYQECSWPPAMQNFFVNNGLVVSLTTALCVTVVFLLVLLFQGHDAIFGIHQGAGAFYQVIPYAALVIPFCAVAAFVLVGLGQGIGRLWRLTGGRPGELRSIAAHLQSAWDVARLKYLDGGGHGCNYPDDRFSMIRRWFHHAIFYGFMLCLASTTIAFFYDHLLHRPAPYAFWSWPVLLGTLGGLGIVAGTGGMLYLKTRMDREPAAPATFGMDVAFTVVLLLTALSGLILLALRSTTIMGTLLVLHIGFVLALFITLPYGKFLHAAYRYTALVRNAIEQKRQKA